jgi:hypothetical protein
MNKVTNRRALAVYLAICLLYVSVAFRIPDKLSMKRLSIKPGGSSHGMEMSDSIESNESKSRGQEVVKKKAVATSPAVAPVAEAQPSSVATVEGLPRAEARNSSEKAPTAIVTAKSSSRVEPRLFISIPITCYAIKEGWLEREALIVSKKDGQNDTWLRPLDILKQHDEDSLKSLAAIIGKDRLKEFMKKEAADIKGELTPEDIVLGRGYVIEKKKLLSLYDRFVSDEWSELFPLVIGHEGVVKGREGFQFVSSAEALRTRKEKQDEEWRMPNLAGLTIKLAIDSLAAHTARIKVHGSGLVTDQNPKPFERLKGDSECAIYGRLASE